MPLVSVIVPCYNYGHFLAETLGSVRAQTLLDWECLVVDDGSTDDTREVVRRFAALDARIRGLFQGHEGPSAARNTGIQEASGLFLQFLDADDLIQPDKLRRQAGFLAERPDVDIVYSGFANFTDGPDGPKLTPSTPARLPENYLAALVRHNLTVISAPLVRREAAVRAGLFDESLREMEDWDFWLRCALAGSRFHAQDWPDALTLVRVHGSSLSRNERRMLEATLRVRAKHGPKLADPALKRLSRRVGFEEAAQMGKHEILHGDLGRGLRLLGGAAVRTGTLKWLLYALALPLLRLRPLQALVPQTQQVWASLRTRGRGNF